LQATFDSQSATQTQQAVFDQATAIVATATAGQAAAETQIATLQGTGGPPGAPTNPGEIVTLTPTLQPSINSTSQPGANGTISNDCRYTVADGDRLYRIALRFGLTQYQLANANRLVNPDLIVPGEILVIPGCTNGMPAIGLTPGMTPTAGTPAPSSSGQTYMVVDGDTLYSIATRFGVRVIALAQANGITNINLIYIGQTLVIP
jgi:LysM repeat protein